MQKIEDWLNLELHPKNGYVQLNNHKSYARIINSYAETFFVFP